MPGLFVSKKYRPKYSKNPVVSLGSYDPARCLYPGADKQFFDSQYLGYTESFFIIF
jgi:hypothetical protein